MSFLLKAMKIPFKLKLPNFSPKQKSGIGLDIGSSSVKLIELETKDKEVFLKKISFCTINQQTSLEIALDSLVNSQGLAGQIVNVSLSGPSTLLRYITFPPMTINELKSTMQFEAKEYIPLPIEEVFLDCAILKERTQDNKMLVLLVAAKKIEVQKRIELLKKLGLIPGVFDVDCLCLVNAFNKLQEILTGKGRGVKPEVVGLLNIGDHFTNMVVVDNSVLRFSRDIPFGGCDITKRISQLEQVDYAQAELIKTDSAKTQQFLPKIEPLISEFSSEVRLSIDYYENQSGQPIEHVYLSGGSSSLPNIGKFLGHLFGVPVDRLDIFPAVNCNAVLNQEELKLKTDSFAIAFGLALRS